MRSTLLPPALLLAFCLTVPALAGGGCCGDGCCGGDGQCAPAPSQQQPPANGK